MRVEPIREADLDYVLDAWHGHVRNAATSETYEIVKPKLTLEFLTGEYWAGWIAYEENSPLGFLWARVLNEHPLTHRLANTATLYISMLWIEPVARNRGTAGELYKALEQYADTHGFHIVCDTHEFLESYLSRHGFNKVNTFIRRAP